MAALKRTATLYQLRLFRSRLCFICLVTCLLGTIFSTAISDLYRISGSLFPLFIIHKNPSWYLFIHQLIINLEKRILAILYT